jgi:hypothetical protein
MRLDIREGFTEECLKHVVVDTLTKQIIWDVVAADDSLGMYLIHNDEEKTIELGEYRTVMNPNIKIVPIKEIINGIWIGGE